jgi:hypothetical protein
VFSARECGIEDGAIVEFAGEIDFDPVTLFCLCHYEILPCGCVEWF